MSTAIEDDNDYLPYLVQRLIQTNAIGFIFQ